MWRAALSLALALKLASASSFFLPEDLRPMHYDLRMTYDLDPATNFTYFGVVDILLYVKNPTSKIVVHAKDFNISKESVFLTGASDPPGVTNIMLNGTYDLLTLTLDRQLQQDANYTLTIPFYGNLKPGLDGVYISTYVNKKTKKKEYLITTQFEAITARKGFPCFDEPMHKATYRITLGHHRQFTAVSNMPLNTSVPANVLETYWPWQHMQKKFKKEITEFVWDEFALSVPMSTYLVAFVVSKFSFVESPVGLSTTKFRIWARSDAINQTAYAATIGPRVLSHFEQYFNVSFPLPKQDMFAIPDFGAGAMENWGLITYRETALLYDKQQSSFLNKERVAEVIAHELAHQWFGNLVTMKWWSDLWLNEGFATFVASVGMAAVEPTWKADRNHAVDNIMSVLNLDSLESSHPVSVTIDDPKRINEIFDQISYRKGSTLIRMMTMYLGEDVFRKAIHNYLVKYSYKNAAQDDLWRELTAANRHGALANVTVKQVMDTWTTQTGYPILTVTRDYGDGSLTITQKRYLSLGARTTTSSSWWVPLRVLCEGEDAGDSRGDALQWLANNEGVTEAHRFEHAAGPNQWVLFNHDMIAPYRVNYDSRNWQLLSDALNSSAYARVPVLARVQLLSDALALAWSSRLPYATALRLTSYLKRETDELPLSTALGALAKIENVLERTPDYGAFQKYVRRLITDTYQRAGGLAAKKIIDGDNLNSVKLQVLTSRWACRMQVPGCEENAIELFQAWMDTSDPDLHNPIPLDLRRTVYCVALRRGGVAAWRFGLARLQRANVAAARDQLLVALACTQELWILAQYLEWAVSEGSVVRRQDAAAVLAAVARSPAGYYLAKEFVYTRIADIHKAFNGQTSRLGSIIKALVDQFKTQRELDEFESWRELNAKYLDDIKLAVRQAVERAAVNVAWVQRNREHVVATLREFAAEPETAPVSRWEAQPNFMLSIFAIHNISSVGMSPFDNISQLR